MPKGAISMDIQRVFKGKRDFKSLIINLLEKEIEKQVTAAYNDKQVDIVAINNAQQGSGTRIPKEKKKGGMIYDGNTTTNTKEVNVLVYS